MVGWSSWLWHLLNTQNVPSSILGSIISYLFCHHINNSLKSIDFHVYKAARALFKRQTSITSIKKINSDTGSRTRVCPVKADHDSRYTISEVCVCLTLLNTISGGSGQSLNFWHSSPKIFFTSMSFSMENSLFGDFYYVRLETPLGFVLRKAKTASRRP